MEKRKVLFVVDEKRMGGVSVLLEDILNMIDISKLKIDVLVLHNNGDMLNNLPKDINLIYGTKYFSSIDYTLKDVIRSFNIKKIFHKLEVIMDMKSGKIEKKIICERKKILKDNYDVEIAFKDGFTALFTAFGDSKKKVHWLHYEYVLTNPNGKYPQLFNRVLPMFDEIVAVSDSVRDAFNKIYHLDNKTKVIYNLVDTKKIINKSKEDCDVKLNKNDFNVISVGRIHPQKGFDRIIKAIHQLNMEGILPKNFKFRLYGSGPADAYLENLIKKYQLEDYVYLMGRVNNPYKYLVGNDLFILSSLYEPFGLVIVEAMTLGIPVMATKNHATGKIINDRENGYITENSYEGIYEGLKYMINNQGELNKYKENLVNYQYDNKKIIKQIERILLNENEDKRDN